MPRSATGSPTACAGCALDGRCPERTVDAGNETDIRGVVVFVGTTV